MRHYNNLSVKIPNGGSLTPAINLIQSITAAGNPNQPNLRLYGILMPVAWTAASITFQLSPDGQNYGEMYDDAGNEYTVTASAGRFLCLNPTAFASAAGLIIRSGTAASPVTQLQDTVLQLSLRDW